MKFLLTREVGRLAKWLRILGFDARYESSENKSLVMLEALKEERIVVTRNQRFGRRHGGDIVFIKHDLLCDQLKELIAALGLKVNKTQLFSRCIICNEVLTGVDKSAVAKSVPAYVYETAQEFKQCMKCHRIYWKGTHWGNAEEILASLNI
jgi:uncharacterized protein with PIN domain